MSGDTDAATSPLQALFEELETLYRTAPIGIGLVDRELKFERVNDRLAEYAGMPGEEMLGRTPSEIAPEIGPKVEPIYRRVLETGEPVLDAAVTGATRADPGRERHWLASYSPLVSADAEIQGVSIIVRDITELKQVQQRLEERVALGQLVAHVATQFVGISSHELGSRITEALRYIAEFFEADVARLGFVTLDGRILPTAHAWFSDRLDAHATSSREPIPISQTSSSSAGVSSTAVSTIFRIGAARTSSGSSARWASRRGSSSRWVSERDLSKPSPLS